jgi:hypothetical protein
LHKEEGVLFKNNYYQIGLTNIGIFTVQVYTSSDVRTSSFGGFLDSDPNGKLFGGSKFNLKAKLVSSMFKKNLVTPPKKALS